ncbi:MAG TPA: DoxX family protein, partial [bacterium]|nr:DoxX family protein [bacterium]
MYVRLLSRFCWLLVGIVFIFSGLIKLNDPVGTAIKLEEY